MLYFKFCLFMAFSLSFLSDKIVLGNEAARLELMRIHESFMSRRGFGVRQEVDEHLCELQNNLTTNTIFFADASGKVPAGILIGNLNHFGQYAQCLSLDETVEEVNIRGKYCMMQVHLTVEQNDPESTIAIPEIAMSGLLGVCVTNACPPIVADQSFNGINISSVELYCREANDKPMAAQDIVAIVLFSFLGLLLILSTGYHLSRKMMYNEDVSKLAKSFSVHHNVTRLTTIPKSGNPLSCINGIRALSMVWVVVGHTYLTGVMITMENPLEVLSWVNSVGATGITAAPLAVDTFFYMAAFLLTWSVLKKFNSSVAFVKSVPLLFINRYLRLTPTLAAVILLQVSLFNHVSDGPDWRPVTAEIDHCLESWWVNLLYLQNYLRPSEICMLHTWYLAVDMQLYLAAPILIVFLFITIKFAISALTMVTVASFGAALGYCYYYNFVTMFASDDGLFMDRYYVNTIPRSPPFVLGIVVAYIVFTLKKRNVAITNEFYIVFHWIVTAVLLIVPCYLVYSTINDDHGQDAINFFNAWHRPAWALGVGGVIVASMHGFGGPVGWFLSLDMWTVPARLSYAMYLIHYPIMLAIIGSAKSPGRFSDSIILFRFVSDLGLTVMAAFLLNVVVEAPFAELCNLLNEKLSGAKKDNQNKLTPKDEAPLPIALAGIKEKQVDGASSV